jgi:hypothetical protein
MVGTAVVPDDLSDVEEARDDFATSDSDFEEDGVPAGAHGDIDMVPPEALEHMAAPLDMSSTEEESDGSSEEDGERCHRAQLCARVVL